MHVICVPTAEERDLLGDLPAGVRAVVWDGRGEAPDGIEDVTFFVPSYLKRPSAAPFAHLPNLKVIQSLSAGVEKWLPLVPPGVVLCNGRGIHGGSTAELAVAGMMSMLRELPYFAAGQAAHRWVAPETDGLDGKRVLVVGAGDIGRRVAAAVAVFDAEPTLVARTARDGVHALDELDELLPEHEIVVIAVPLTEATTHLVGTAFLAAMPDRALLVNVARGPIVDTDALLRELTTGRLSAFLDVTDPEPLPAEHPLWDAPNVVITPHVGGGTRGWDRRAYRLVREQIERLVAGEPLHNIVGDTY